MIIPTFDFHVLGWPETHELGQWETPSKQMDVNGWWCGQRKGCGPRLGSTTQRLRAASKSGTGGANWLERTQNRKPRLASSTSPSTQRSQTMTASQRWELPSQYTHLHHTKTEPSEFLPRVPSPKNPRTQRKKKDRGRSDFHRFPPRRSARRQDLWKRGTDHRYSLYSPRSESRTATFAGRARAWLLTVGSRGYRSSTRVGYVASLGSKEEDNYFRSDSMKYCRHEEKKEKRRGKGGGRAVVIYFWGLLGRGVWRGGAAQKLLRGLVGQAGEFCSAAHDRQSFSPGRFSSPRHATDGIERADDGTVEMLHPVQGFRSLCLDGRFPLI